MKRKIIDLGENEVINTPTVEEAIEINKTLNPQWTEEKVRGLFDAFNGNVCFEKEGTIQKSFAETLIETKITPASDFLPTEFYKTVEPKVGQVWCCTNNVMPPYEGNPNYFIHKFTVGKTYTLVEDSPKEDAFIQPNPFEIMDDNNERVTFGKGLDFRNFFRFVSEPADKLKIEEKCEHSVSLVDPETYKQEPYTEGPEIGEFKTQMLVQSPDYVDPRIIEMYKQSDPKHRELMREMFDAEWPVVKDYITAREFGAFFTVHHDTLDDVYTIGFKNCTPEISGNEIRFVKEV
jgi:hypothetical protein